MLLQEYIATICSQFKSITLKNRLILSGTLPGISRNSLVSKSINKCEKLKLKTFYWMRHYRAFVEMHYQLNLQSDDDLNWFTFNFKSRHWNLRTSTYWEYKALTKQDSCNPQPKLFPPYKTTNKCGNKCAIVDNGSDEKGMANLVSFKLLSILISIY